MDPTDALHAMGGSARTRDLLKRCSRRSLQAALTEGAVLRVARGRYVLPEASRAAVAAAAASGVLAGASAAVSYGWAPLHRPDGAVVAVLPGQRVEPLTGVRYLRRRLSPDERHERRTGPLATVVVCATSLSFVDGLCVADAALRSGLVLPEELSAAAAGFGGHGAEDLRRVARHADHRAANALESGLRGHLIEARLTTFAPQHVVTAPGFFAAVDLADPDRRVALEADGWSTHGSRRAFAADLQRHDELAALGWVTLRFAWEHVMFRPNWVVDRVRDVLRRRRPVPGSRRPRTDPRQPRTDQRPRTEARRDPAA